MEKHSGAKLVGKVIAGKYLLKKLLGEGGMGNVYLAEHTGFQEARAVKVIKEEVADKEKIRERFMHEIRMTRLASRASEHIVFIYDDFGFEDGFGYYVMEYLEGMLLEERIEQNPGSLPLPWILRVAMEICEALQVAHDKGMIFRDLKPANIFLTTHRERNDFVKVIDFGIAKSDNQSHLTSMNQILGTPFYMSPEQIKGPTKEQWKAGETYIDTRSDIYALGCVIYEMIVGKPPFYVDGPQNNFMGIFFQHLYEPPKDILRMRPDVPQTLQDVVFKALAKSPDDRFQSMTQLSQVLQNCLASLEANTAPVAQEPANPNATVAYMEPFSPTPSVAPEPANPNATVAYMEALPAPATSLTTPTKHASPAQEAPSTAKKGNTASFYTAKKRTDQLAFDATMAQMPVIQAEDAPAEVAISEMNLSGASPGNAPPFEMDFAEDSFLSSVSDDGSSLFDVDGEPDNPAFWDESTPRASGRQVHPDTDEVGAFSPLSHELASQREATIVTPTLSPADLAALVDSERDATTVIPILQGVSLEEDPNTATLTGQEDPQIGVATSMGEEDLNIGIPTLMGEEGQPKAQKRVSVVQNTSRRQQKLSDAWLRPLPGKTAGHGARRLVLWPFRFSGDPEERYLADGLVDTLYDFLSSSSGLQVCPRGALVPFLRGELSPQEVGKQLKGDVLLEGSLYKDEDGVELRVGVRDLGSDTVLWKQTFQSESKGLMESINTIVHEVILMLVGRAPTSSPIEMFSESSIMEMYLRARHELRLSWNGDLSESIVLFQQALTYAPGHPLLLAGLAVAWARRAFFRPLEDNQELARAMTLAKQALRAGPNLSEPLYALAMICFLRYEWGRALKYLEKALKRKPFFADAHDLTGRILLEVGSLKRATSHLRRALHFEPSLVNLRWDLVRAHAFVHRWDEVDALFRLPVEGNDISLRALCHARFNLWRPEPQPIDYGIAFQQGNFIHEGIKYFQQTLLSGQFSEIGYTVFMEGRFKTSASPRRQCLIIQELVEILAYTQQWELCLNTLELVNSLQFCDLNWMRHCPLLEPIRADSRFLALLYVVEERVRKVRG